jgi:CubicO group peptidase (beta-lactamase class C family)
MMNSQQAARRENGLSRRLWRRVAHALLVAAGVTLVAAMSADRARAQRVPELRIPPPRFADGARAAKLRSAFPAIDAAFRDFIAREHIPGAAWGVVVDGALAHIATAGVRETTAKAPVQPDTVFRIASMTKSFTALAILKLRDEGRLSLDDPAEKYVPELKLLTYPSDDSPRITIRHLLSHAEGFPEDNPWADQQLAATEADLSRMIRSGIPFSNAPGLAYEYSNYGFAILGRIVSNVSKIPYSSYIATNVLQPLGMTATTLEPKLVPAGKLAHGYRWEDERWKEEPQLADGAFGAMGGMLTSVSDLARYVSVYLAAFPPRSDAETGPLRRASLREMQQIARPRPSTVIRGADGVFQLNAGGYGFGLGITETCQFGHVVAHSGGLPGFGSQMRWLPEYGVGIVALGNRTYSGWGGVVGTAIDLLDKTGALQRREVQPSAALIASRAAVSRLVEKWDDVEAERLAAVNLFLDRAKERRRQEIETLRAKVGVCTPDSGFVDVENALRGRWSFTCERGKLQASITLAPTMPPKVQFLEVAPLQPPSRATCAP